MRTRLRYARAAEDSHNWMTDELNSSLCRPRPRSSLRTAINRKRRPALSSCLPLVRWARRTSRTATRRTRPNTHGLRRRLLVALDPSTSRLPTILRRLQHLPRGGQTLARNTAADKAVSLGITVHL